MEKERDRDCVYIYIYIYIWKHWNKDINFSLHNYFGSRAEISRFKICNIKEAKYKVLLTTKGFTYLLILRESLRRGQYSKLWLFMNILFGLVLWHINHCRLFNDSIWIYILYICLRIGIHKYLSVYRWIYFIWIYIFYICICIGIYITYLSITIYLLISLPPSLSLSL